MSNVADLWIQEGDWQKYEHYIFGALQRRFPGARVVPNAHLPGLKSGRDRQIDVLVELEIGGCNIRIAFDCKCYKRNVDVKHVESFLGMLEDIRVSQGVLVTTKGYSKTAHERAMRESRAIDLQILGPDRLSEYQFVGCLWFWKGGVAAVVEPPGGWVVDIENIAGPFQFSMYPLGHHRESAVKMCPFLYGAIVLKTEAAATIEVIAAEDERVVTANYPAAKFEYLPTQSTEEPDTPRKTLLRVGHVDPSYGGPEYSLYLDMPKGVLRLVLLCPLGQENHYLPVLMWVRRGAVYMFRKDEGNPPLSANEMNAVGCNLFPLGLRKSLLESRDRELKVV
jgi:hypothetical protein